MTNTSSSKRAKHPSAFLWVALTAGIALIVSAGTLYGHYSQRWGPPVELLSAGEYLESMPGEMGPWKLVEEEPISAAALEMLECAGYVNRRYLNQENGQSVGVSLLVGPPGPIAVHTPEICYSSRAFELESVRKEVSTESSTGENHTFWSVDFRTRDAFADRLRVYYAWSRGENWGASAAPRYEFAAAPLLYKIQLAGSIGAESEKDRRDPCHEFLEALINSNWKMASFKLRDN